MDPERIYLDYNATSPLSQSVTNWLKSGDLLSGNPSSQHTSGKSSRKAINESRSYIYSLFGKSEKDTRLFFHSGATEAISTVAYSFSEWARRTDKNLLICYSRIDHPAVTSLAERYFGDHVKFQELNIDQNLDYAHSENLRVLTALKQKNPELIILYHHLWVHNETGIVAPLKLLKEFSAIPDLFIHVDAVQSPGKIADWKELSVGDIFTFSGHKFGAMKGIGFSFLNKNISFTPLMSGGGQQAGLRSGTENPLGIKSLQLALSDLEKVNIKQTYDLKEQLELELEKELSGIGGIISKRGKVRNSNTIYFYLSNLSSDIALALFDLNGLMISAGSACSSGTAKDSEIMLHQGFKKEAKNGLRISMSYGSTRDDLQKILQNFRTTFQKIRSA